MALFGSFLIRPMRYAGNCTQIDGDDINEMKRVGKQLDEDEFFILADPRDLKQLTDDFSVPLKDDWHVNYFEGPLPSGKHAIWFTHSGIEHVFTVDGQL